MPTLSRSPYLFVCPSSVDGRDFAVDCVNGHLDLLDERLSAVFGCSSKLVGLSEFESEYCETRGYGFSDDERAEDYVSHALLDAEEYLRSAPLSMLVVPTYSCNYSCDYCFQRNLNPAQREPVLSKRQLSRVATCITEIEARHEKLPGSSEIYVYGGEPLQADARVHDMIAAILDRFAEYPELFIITNGRWLSDYVELLSAAPNVTVQVTVDGPPAIHDQRRHGESSDDCCAILQGIEKYLNEAAGKLLLRTNVDASNLEQLPVLRSILWQKGILGHPRLRHAFVSPVMRRGPDAAVGPDAGVVIQKRLIDLFLSEGLHEHMDIANVRGYQYARAAAGLGGGRVIPCVYRCEAMYGKYIFDPLDRISVCEEACARNEGIVGRYTDRLYLDSELWRRSVKELRSCDQCVFRFACAGGCAWEAMTRHGTPRHGACDGFGEMLAYGLRALHGAGYVG